MAKTPLRNDPRNIKIEEMKAALNKAYGENFIMRMGDKPSAGIQVVPTGSLKLDIALGIGGLPRGRIVEIYGPESSGKTTVALHVIANAQKAGGVCAFIDAEHALDPDYAKRLGVNIDELLITQPNCGEQGLEAACQMAESGELAVIVVDSVAALAPRQEIEGEIGDSLPGLHARLMAQALRKLPGPCSKTNTLLVFINQIRMKIGVMYGSPETTTGGNSLKFYSSVRIDIRRREITKDKDGDITGNMTVAKVVKNKLAPPHKQAEFEVLYGHGIDRLGEIVDLAVDTGVIKKSGAWFSYESKNIGQGRDKTKEFLTENPDVMKSIEKQVMEKIRG